MITETQRAVYKRYRETHREQIRAYEAGRREKQREYQRAYHARLRPEQVEKYAQKKRAYYAGPGKLKRREYEVQNKDRIAAAARARYAADPLARVKAREKLAEHRQAHALKGPGPCECCGADGGGVHHRDGDHANNAPDNLERLCCACHKMRHRHVA